MGRIKGILFDKDGTLIEFESSWHRIMGTFFQTLDEGYGFSREKIEALKRYAGYGEESFERESPIQSVSTHEILWRFQRILRPEDEGFFQVLLELFNAAAKEGASRVTLLEGVKETLTALKEKGYYLGIATADTRASTLESLSVAGILDYFDYLGVDDGLVPPKPDPGHALLFARKAGIGLEEILIVGDSLSDYLFAQNAGVPFVGIRAGYNQFSEMEEEDLIIADGIGEIIENLKLL